MKYSKLKLIYFSPTKTTKKVVENITLGLQVESIEHVDVTRPGFDDAKLKCASDELLLIACPVYAGRIPKVFEDRIKSLAGSGDAIAVVVYGNRDYDDALLELTDILKDSGFNPFAAGVFIGEHSFSSEESPVAVNRPDSSDISLAKEFGVKILDKLNSKEPLKPVKVKGNRPYKERVLRDPDSPISNDNCQLCGACERVCPTAAIKVGASVETTPELCIFCCACVRVCAFDARKMQIPRILTVAKWLNENCSSRQEPELYI